MLSIRLQRVGRKGHAMYRVIVQDSHRQPTSGKIVAQLGTYDPHTKAVVLDKQKAETYLKNGAQPTPRVVSLLIGEKVSLPKWVQTPSDKKQKAIRNAEKLRRNQPKEESVEAPAEEPAVEAEAPVVEASDEVAQSSTKDNSGAVEAEQSVEQIAEAEVEDGQETAEEE